MAPFLNEDYRGNWSTVDDLNDNSTFPTPRVMSSRNNSTNHITEPISPRSVDAATSIDEDGDKSFSWHRVVRSDLEIIRQIPTLKDKGGSLQSSRLRRRSSTTFHPHDDGIRVRDKTRSTRISFEAHPFEELRRKTRISFEVHPFLVFDDNNDDSEEKE